MNSEYITDLKNQFKDKVIVITGSTQGSGAETAKLFAHRGAKAITVCGRQAKQGELIKKEIKSIGSKCIYVNADLNIEDKFILLNSGSATGNSGIIHVTRSYLQGPIKCKEYDATIDITSSWPLIGIGGVNREVVFGTACQLPDGRWIEKR